MGCIVLPLCDITLFPKEDDRAGTGGKVGAPYVEEAYSPKCATDIASSPSYASAPYVTLVIPLNMESLGALGRTVLEDDAEDVVAMVFWVVVRYNAAWCSIATEREARSQATVVVTVVTSRAEDVRLIFSSSSLCIVS